MVFGENFVRPHQFPGCCVHAMQSSQSAQSIDFPIAVSGSSPWSAFTVIIVKLTGPIANPDFVSGLQIVSDQGFLLSPLLNRKRQAIGDRKRGITAAYRLPP